MNDTEESSEPSLENGYPDPEVEGVDETFEIISNKEKSLKEALAKVEKDLIGTEINLSVCKTLIDLYEREIIEEQLKNQK